MINLSDNAKKEAKRRLEELSKPGAFIRMSVRLGGCSGMSYDLTFDDQIKESDKVSEVDGIKIVSDPKSLVYVDNMTIDYSDKLVGGGFLFVNPNAKGSCGCGISFST